MSMIFGDERARAALARTCAPIEQARGLPNEAYGDPAWGLAERERAFDRQWACVAPQYDAPNPGSVAPIDHLGRPLLLARDKKGVLRVFHNVCSHRGFKLYETRQEGVGVLRCPYHSWCYALDGALKITPHVGGPGQNKADGFDPSAHGLKEVRSALWMGMVFVDLSGQAPPFERHVEGLEARWRDIAGKRLVAAPDMEFSLDVACNWKLAVENYCESYHLPWIHPGLNAYSRLEDHYNVIEDGFSGQGTLVYKPQIDPSGARFPAAEGLSSKWDEGAEYVALYPNVLLGVHNDHVFAIQLAPRDGGRTIERVCFFFYDEAALDVDRASMRKTLAAMWREIFEEDVMVVEGMQKGRASPGFDGGVMSPVMDPPTHAFNRWVASTLLGEEGRKEAAA